MLKGAREKKIDHFFEKILTMNSDASAALKLLAQFSSASFTPCIVATLRKALAIRRAGARRGTYGVCTPYPKFLKQRNQRALTLEAPLGG